MAKDPASRIASLRKQIARHDELYYRKTQPEISDFDYDVLKKELESLEKINPGLAIAEKPPEPVGDDRTEGFATVRHRKPMQSLDNTYNEKELRDFDTRLIKIIGGEKPDYVVEPKIDGLAVCLTFENGKFVRAVTRGNGVEGDDITENVRTIRSLPAKLSGRGHPDIIEVRGEIYLGAEEFQRINAERQEAGLPLYANARNLASGTAKMLDPAEVARRKLQIILYGLGHCEPMPCKTQHELHTLLREWGLPGHPKENTWRANGIDEVWERIQKLDKLRHDFAYATDGAVVKLDDFALQETAGSTAKAPRWAIAYKFAPEQAETKLNSITIQVGRTGILAPVAELEPVFLAGSTISRATLHNADEIERKKDVRENAKGEHEIVGVREGDRVIIEKAGEVIPAVVWVVKEKRPSNSQVYHFPEKCPACGTKAVRLDGEVAWRCTNLNCPPQITRRLQFFCSRKALDIEDVGEIVADKLTTSGLVKTPLDLFGLTVEQLKSLNLGDEKNPRIFGEKNARRVIEAIDRARNLPLSRWLYALGIANVGDVTAKDISYHHNDINQLKDSPIIKKVLDRARLENENKENKSNKPAPLLRRLQFKHKKEKINEINKKLYMYWTVSKSTGKNVDEEEASSVYNDLIQKGKLNQKERSLEKILELNRKKEQEVIDPKKKTRIHQLIAKCRSEIPEIQNEIKNVETKLSHYQFMHLIGTEVAKSINSYFESPINQAFFSKLNKLGINPISDNLQSIQTLGVLTGKNFVLTGTLPSLKREEATAMIEAAGGKVLGSVSAKTNYVVTGVEAGSKLDKARELGVDILDEKGLLSLLKAKPIQKELFE